MTRETTVIKLATSFGENLVSVIVGLLFIAGGGWVAHYALATEPHSDKLLWTGVAVAIFGASMMPSILPKVKQIVVIVQGIPVLGAMLGGRRSTDPQPPSGGSQ
jgi:hypothetical protein